MKLLLKVLSSIFFASPFPKYPTHTFDTQLIHNRTRAARSECVLCGLSNTRGIHLISRALPLEFSPQRHPPPLPRPASITNTISMNAASRQGPHRHRRQTASALGGASPVAHARPSPARVTRPADSGRRLATTEAAALEGGLEWPRLGRRARLATPRQKNGLAAGGETGPNGSCAGEAIGGMPIPCWGIAPICGGI